MKRKMKFKDFEIRPACFIDGHTDPKKMKDLCATCDIPERDYDPSDPEYFCCSDCSCYYCKYLHCCEGQCAEEGAE